MEILMKLPNTYSQDEYFGRLGKHKWRCSRLFKLTENLPILDIPLDHLCVYYKLTRDAPTLREVASEMKRIMKADLNYPIILDEDGEIIDGRHRVIKALYLGHKTIKAVRFDTNPEPDEIEKD